ncbi:MAG: hypothetical protein HQK89_14480 [Nitrospirae bacterium]|nr:hypothetical protein [Nitrospirota bacterium]
MATSKSFSIKGIVKVPVFTRARFTTTVVAIMVFSCTSLLSYTLLYAESDKEGGSSLKLFKGSGGDKKPPLIITSKTLNADNKKKTAVFTGAVKAVKGETTFFADTMVVYYSNTKKDGRNQKASLKNAPKVSPKDDRQQDREGPRSPSDSQTQIDRIEATGNVKLINGKNVITSDRATYFGDEEKVIFTGNPQAQDDKNHITGTKMTYYMKDDRSVVENSRVEMQDKDSDNSTPERNNKEK